MIFDLTISYPWWFLILVVAIGFVYAAILYIRNRKQKFNAFWRIILFAARFLVVAILAFLLLSPFIKTTKRNVEKPILVVGVDNSRSIVLGKDSSFIKTLLNENLRGVEKELSTTYRVDSYVFGKDVVPADQADFSDEVSNYAMFFKYLKETYKGVNIGAVVLAGDGISNRGIDPEYSAAGFPVPVYSLGLGDTTQNRDLKINDVRFNSIVYLDDDFPLEVNVSANGYKGKTATVEISAFGKMAVSEKVNITRDKFNQSVNVKLSAKTVGRQRINIRILTEEDEINPENNERNIFINVLNNRQKILIMANAPHPDIAAIKQSLELNQNYETEVQFANNQKGKITDFDLVILHQLPSGKEAVQQLLNDLKTNKTPVFYVLGKQSNLVRFNRHFSGVEFNSQIRSFEEAQCLINQGFTLFSFQTELARQLEKLPPLIVPFGNYTSSLNTNVFASQRINRVNTNLPLIAFYENPDSRYGVVLGEGLWMWRLQSYLQFNDTKAFDNFILKSVQYLMARKDKRFFRVITEGEYNSADKVELQAELYNSAYELVNEPDVYLRLTNEAGEQFNFVFSPIQQSYILELESLPLGVYRYTATTNYGGKDYSDRGEFIIRSQSLESRQLNANHAMLYRISEKTGGTLLYPNEFSQLQEILNNRDDLKSRIYFEEKYTGLNNLPWLIGLILFLLSLEWFLRKYFGLY